MFKVISAQLVSFTICICCSSSYAGTLDLQRSAKSGSDSIIGYERAWDGSCSPINNSVTILDQPQHGTASVVSGTSTIPASTPRHGSTGVCADKQIVGSQVMYKSSAGFHGQDHVSWEVTTKNGVDRVNVIINVR